MAWANGGAELGPRSSPAVLFGLNTIYWCCQVSRAGPVETRIFVGLGWLLGLGAIVLLWRGSRRSISAPAGT